MEACEVCALVLFYRNRERLFSALSRGKSQIPDLDDRWGLSTLVYPDMMMEALLLSFFLL